MSPDLPASLQELEQRMLLAQSQTCQMREVLAPVDVSLSFTEEPLEEELLSMGWAPPTT